MKTTSQEQSKPLPNPKQKLCSASKLLTDSEFALLKLKVREMTVAIRKANPTVKFSQD